MSKAAEGFSSPPGKGSRKCAAGLHCTRRVCSMAGRRKQTLACSAQQAGAIQKSAADTQAGRPEDCLEELYDAQGFGQLASAALWPVADGAAQLFTWGRASAAKGILTAQCSHALVWLIDQLDGQSRNCMCCLTWLIGQLSRSSQASSLMSEVSWPVRTRAITSSRPLPLCCLFWLARRSDTSSRVTCSTGVKAQMLPCCLSESLVSCKQRQACSACPRQLQPCKEEQCSRHKQILGCLSGWPES